jgi:hypothetical protein
MIDSQELFAPRLDNRQAFCNLLRIRHFCVCQSNSLVFLIANLMHHPFGLLETRKPGFLVLLEGRQGILPNAFAPIVSLFEVLSLWPKGLRRGRGESDLWGRTGCSGCSAKRTPSSCEAIR